MTTLRRVPPGRAGRMWLRRRLAVAERGHEQLDRKLHILLAEADRARTLADERREQWRVAVEEAQRWYVRAVLLGGEDANRRAAPRTRAAITLSWTSTAGLRYPAAAECTYEDEDSWAGGVPAAAVAVVAGRAFRRAVSAAASAAVADEALRRITAEIAGTRQRLQALDKRWLPELRDGLAALDLALEQAEQEDAARLQRGRAGRDLRHYL